MYLSNDNLATGAAWIAQLCCVTSTFQRNNDSKKLTGSIKQLSQDFR